MLFLYQDGTKMRQPDWFRFSSTPTQVPLQHRASFFIGISVTGTFIALIVLVFDGWFDALAAFIICSLLLAILLSQMAAQQQSHARAAASKAGDRQLDLISKRLSWFWSKSSVHPKGADQPVSPPALSKLSSTD